MSDNNYSLISNYEFKKDIGEGNFGKVKLAIFKPTGEEFAIKILNKKLIREKMKNITFQENEIILKFNHINVVYVYEIIDEIENYYIVMEYCKLGDLFDYIVNNKRLDEDEASIFFYQLINGVEYIHNLGYAHRDLKPENLLLCKNKILKIIDFGLSREYNEEELLTTKCGSPSYASPELIMGKPYDAFKTDIWSCGIILYGMLCGYLPFDGDDTKQLFMEILENKPEYPFILSDSSKSLIKSMLLTDPEERITIEEIKQSDIYLNGKRLCNIDYNSLNDFLVQRDMYYRKKHNFNISNNKNTTIESNNSLKEFGDKKRIKFFFENRYSLDKNNKNELNLDNIYTKLINNKINCSVKDSIYLKTTDNNRNIINVFRQKVINNGNIKNKNLGGPSILFTDNNLSPKKKKNDVVDNLKNKYNNQKKGDNNEKNHNWNNNCNYKNIVKPKENNLFINSDKKLKEIFNLKNNEHNNNHIASLSVNKRNNINIERNNFFHLNNKIHDERLKFNNINIKTQNNNNINSKVQTRNNNNVNQNNYSYNNLFNDLNKKRDKNRFFLSPQNYNKQDLYKNNNKNILKINKLNVDKFITQKSNKKIQMPSSPMNSIHSNKLFLNSLLFTDVDHKNNDKILEHEKKNINDIKKNYYYDNNIISQIAKGLVSPIRYSKYIRFNRNEVEDNSEDNYNNTEKNKGKTNSVKKNIKLAHQKLRLNIKCNNKIEQFGMIHCSSEKNNNYFPLIEG